jgi:hypothetical protein
VFAFNDKFVAKSISPVALKHRLNHLLMYYIQCVVRSDAFATVDEFLLEILSATSNY